LAAGVGFRECEAVGLHPLSETDKKVTFAHGKKRFESYLYADVMMTFVYLPEKATPTNSTT
jgi:hypothetical protein